MVTYLFGNNVDTNVAREIASLGCLEGGEEVLWMERQWQGRGGGASVSQEEDARVRGRGRELGPGVGLHRS